MIKLLESTILGNTVGIISFIIGIISFILTIKVNKSTTKIKQLVDKAQSKAINVTSLRAICPDVIDRLYNLSQSIKNAKYVSWNTAVDISEISTVLLQYKDCIEESNIDEFLEANNYIVSFSETDDEEKARKLLMYIASIISILKKGDFIDGR